MNKVNTYEVRYFDDLDMEMGSKVVTIKARTIEDALDEARARAWKRVGYVVGSIQLVGRFKEKE